MKKFLKITGIFFLSLIVVLVILVIPNLRDSNPGYKADMTIINNEKSAIRAGFAAIPITPEVPDTWVDADKDAEYNPKKGDTYTDGNGNGKFDPVWIAGFGNARAANGVHDDIWARTIVIDDGKTRIAIVALDVIGFMNNNIVDVRGMIPESTGVKYTIIASNHPHEGPDLLGLWGKTPFKSGINREYLKFVMEQIVKSVETAVANIRPVRLEISQDLTGAVSLVKDTRDPQVFDCGLRIIKAIDREDGKTLGSLIAWADHPETVWSDNLLVTSDFPHYVREYVEKGIFRGDSLIKPGIGGVSVYLNGALGGLMTTHPSLAVKDPVTGEEFKEPTFSKADAHGKQVALLTLNAMENPVESVDSAGISLVVRTVFLPIENTLFRLGTAVGVLDRGMVGWMKMRSELAVFNIGPLSFSTIPGEAYPELINGGVEAPEGQDFKTEPLEVPAIRDMMAGKYKFVFCLANDEIGYIIPKSQWDVEAPYTYNRKDSPYGEENSLGPETASILHSNLKDMLGELNGKRPLTQPSPRGEGERIMN